MLTRSKAEIMAGKPQPIQILGFSSSAGDGSWLRVSRFDGVSSAFPSFCPPVALFFGMAFPLARKVR